MQISFFHQILVASTTKAAVGTTKATWMPKLYLNHIFEKRKNACFNKNNPVVLKRMTTNFDSITKIFFLDNCFKLLLTLFFLGSTTQATSSYNILI